MRRALVLASFLAAPILSPSPAAHAAPRTGARAPDIVQIKTSDGQTLQGSFYRPGGSKPAAGKVPGVVLIHAAGGSRAQLEPLAISLSKEGFGVLSFDLRGHGGSQSAALNWDNLSETDRQATWSVATKDLDAAAHWLLEQPTIQPTNLSLVAYGSGCTLAVRHAKGDDYVVCMALLAPNVQDVQADIRSMKGLPTFVVTSKDDATEKMVQEANAPANSPDGPYVEIFPIKVPNPLEVKQVPGKVTEWVGGKALPKRGGRS